MPNFMPESSNHLFRSGKNQSLIYEVKENSEKRNVPVDQLDCLVAALSWG